MGPLHWYICVFYLITKRGVSSVSLCLFRFTDIGASHLCDISIAQDENGKIYYWGETTKGKPLFPITLNIFFIYYEFVLETGIKSRPKIHLYKTWSKNSYFHVRNENWKLRMVISSDRNELFRNIAVAWFSYQPLRNAFFLFLFFIFLIQKYALLFLGYTRSSRVFRNAQEWVQMNKLTFLWWAINHYRMSIFLLATENYLTIYWIKCLTKQESVS